MARVIMTHAIKIAECTAFLTRSIPKAAITARGPRIQNIVASGAAVLPTSSARFITSAPPATDEIRERHPCNNSYRPCLDTLGVVASTFPRVTEQGGRP